MSKRKNKKKKKLKPSQYIPFNHIFFITTLKLLYFLCLQRFFFKRYCIFTWQTFCAAKKSERLVSIPSDSESYLCSHSTSNFVFKRESNFSGYLFIYLYYWKLKPYKKLAIPTGILRQTIFQSCPMECLTTWQVWLTCKLSERQQLQTQNTHRE